MTDTEERVGQTERGSQRRALADFEKVRVISDRYGIAQSTLRRACALGVLDGEKLRATKVAGKWYMHVGDFQKIFNRGGNAAYDEAELGRLADAGADLYGGELQEQ
ncbi:MAG: hypothetical protein ACYTEQ_01775 [Planctomycetota bacterium]|jgi:hypothetical protein